MGCCFCFFQELYLDLSNGAGGTLVILQRRGGDGPTGTKGLGEWRHLGTRRDLHAGKVGGIQLLLGVGGRGGETHKALTSESSKTFSFIFRLFLSLESPPPPPPPPPPAQNLLRLSPPSMWLAVNLHQRS